MSSPESSNVAGAPAAPRRPQARRKFSWKVKLLAIAVSGVFGLLLAEIGLRVIGFSKPNFYQMDKDLGFSAIPNARGLWSAEGPGYVSINAHGMRDVPRTVAKPKNTFRVAVLGDSNTAAFQVDREENYCAVLERQLKSCDAVGGKNVEVLNFGVGGFGTAQQYLQLHERVWRFEPDLVLLGFMAGNDIRNNSKVLEWEQIRPFYLLKNGELVLDQSFRQDPSYLRRNGALGTALYWVLNHCRLVQVAREARGVLIDPKAARSERAAMVKNAGVTEAGLDDMIFLEPDQPVRVEAWEITERLIKKIADDAAKHKVPFVLVNLSIPMQVHPDAKARQDVCNKLNVPDLLYPNRRLKQFSDREGIAFLDLVPELLKYADSTGKPLHGFAKTSNLGTGHWNQEGHRLAGESMAKWVCSLLADRQSVAGSVTVRP